MSESYRRYKQLYHSFDNDRLMKKWLHGNLSADSEAALKKELRNRGLDCSAETTNLLELSDGAIERKINRGAVWKAVFRMLSVAAIFFGI